MSGFNVDIEQDVSPDNLSRKLWSFRVQEGYILLTGYAEQNRETTRHKFKGPRWASSDERSYVSALSRPTSIPESVIAEVRQAWADKFKAVPLYIGWTNEKSRVL